MPLWLLSSFKSHCFSWDWLSLLQTRRPRSPQLGYRRDWLRMGSNLTVLLQVSICPNLIPQGSVIKGYARGLNPKAAVKLEGPGCRAYTKGTMWRSRSSSTDQASLLSLSPAAIRGCRVVATCCSARQDRNSRFWTTMWSYESTDSGCHGRDTQTVGTINEQWTRRGGKTQ